jgi:hypothetical protein
MWANWRTPPFMPCSQRSRIAAIRWRCCRNPVVASFLSASASDADAHGGFVLVERFGERELERQARAVRQQRLHLEAVVRPLALQTGDQCALERRVRLRLEQIHERDARERILAGVAEQLEPRPVGIHDDALLHVGDGVGRSLEEFLQLLPILARRRQGGGQGALEAVRAQLPRGDRLQPRAVGERHHVLRAEAHRVGDRRLIDLLAHDQHRHARGGLLLDLGDGAQVDAELIDEHDQQFGIDLGDRIGQVAGIRQPGAVHRVTGLPQRAVDRLDVILGPRHDDHRNGALLAHCAFPRERSRV